MNWKDKQKISKYAGIYLVFFILFSLFMLVLASYDRSISRRQLLTLIDNYPNLESDIISVWSKHQRPFTHPETEGSIEENIRIIEQKYGYDLNAVVSEPALWLFWGAGLLIGVLAVSVFAFFDVRMSQKSGFNFKMQQEIYNCLEQFQSGVFSYTPDLADGSAEWLKIRESLRELGVYFSNLKEQLHQEEANTKTLVTDISHQLKTPLASLKMSHELVVANALSEMEKQEFLQQEEREIEKLELLIKELVNLSRLEAHMIQIQPTEAWFKPTLTAAVSQNYMKARNKDIEIQVTMDQDIRICHDVKWTEEAIANVLDNAVKYSPPHTTITIRVSALTCNLMIEIEDEGIGLSPDELSKIYCRFYRGRQARQTVQEGAGVGLYLTRMILEHQKGTICAMRKLGSGTIFKLTLPLLETA